MQVKKYFKWENESGFTLIELLAAITILSIIVISFLSLFIQGARTNTRASDINEATFIAQEEMELVIFHSYDRNLNGLIDSIDQLETHDANLTDEGWVIGSISSGFQVETTISEADIDDLPDLYSVIVKVKQTRSTLSIMENRLTLENED